MKKSTSKIAILAMSAVVLAVAPACLHATQKTLDANSVTPHLYETLVENERVKVSMFILEPGVKEEWHTHPDAAYHVLSGGKMHIVYGDGTEKVANMHTGLTFYLDATHKHTAENVGDTAIKVLITEVKVSKG